MLKVQQTIVSFKPKLNANLESRFSHPNLVSFIGIAEKVGSKEVLLVTEKLSGNLRHLIKTCPADQFTWSLRIALALDAAKGLAFLHAKRIIHRGIYIFPRYSVILLFLNLFPKRYQIKKHGVR